MTEKLLPLASMEKVLKQGGAHRVSESAKEALKEAIEKKAEEIAKKAVALTFHAGRRTVKSKDIKMALKD